MRVNDKTSGSIVEWTSRWFMGLGIVLGCVGWIMAWLSIGASNDPWTLSLALWISPVLWVFAPLVMFCAFGMWGPLLFVGLGLSSMWWARRLAQERGVNTAG